MDKLKGVFTGDDGVPIEFEYVAVEIYGSDFDHERGGLVITTRFDLKQLIGGKNGLFVMRVHEKKGIKQFAFQGAFFGRSKLIYRVCERMQFHVLNGTFEELNVSEIAIQST